MINHKDIIEKTRLFMKKEKINFLIVFSSDEYLNEYIDLNENSRFLLTGFSGSTGDALVTLKEIFLFADGRYHLQAEQEADKGYVTVVKVGMDKSPQNALYEKIAELSDHTAKIGIISKKINCGGFRKLLDIMSDKNASYKEFDFDPITEIAGIKKPEILSELRFIPTEISGLSAEEKLDLIISNNKKTGIAVLVITKLEEIAYLTNLRGNEITYSSSFKAKIVINSEKCFIFTDLNKITPEIKEELGSRFVFEEEEVCCDILADLEKIHGTINIGYDFYSMNLSDCRKLEKLKHKLIEVKENPISLMKSVKNNRELEHMQECFLKTDNAVSRAISWLSQQLEKSPNEDLNGNEEESEVIKGGDYRKISEKDFSDKVKSLFFEEGALGLSFETIAASGRNTAFIHYTKADPDKFIKPGELVLLDCGAYFEGGYATDITRTFLAGGSDCRVEALESPRNDNSQKQREIYTKVLKAFLNGINYELDENSTGFDIDKKVREIIEKTKPEGFNFSHGTGHGIGISVHESPPRLGPSEVSKTKLLPGMCFTVEPGLYSDGWGGVRIENSVTIIEESGKLKIKSLTKAKLDDNLIDTELLSEQEKIWLENYQK